ncbi:type II secretion system protein GspD, partial [Pseudomonas fragariae (ex Marin et al. 2024)]
KSLDASTRITAQKSSNQLLVRTRPAQWKEIESAIKRLDNPPLQVQIETRILEVKLTGELDMGVQWYLGRLAGNSGTTGNVTNTAGSQGAIGTGGAALASTDAFFYSFVSNNLQVALRALETNGRTQVLSAPSLVVMNNQQAQIQVGDNIPISQTSINTNTNTGTTLSSVEYVQTGVILDVVPRINPGGLVYMDIQQQV